MTPWLQRIGATELAAPVTLFGMGLVAAWWALPKNWMSWSALAAQTGWIGTSLLVASLALMVREPRWAALMGGLDTMYRWHHRGGVVAYVFLLCHPLALGMVGLAASPRAAWLAIAPWALDWPGRMGWIGLLCLMAGLTSTFSRHIGYRGWRTFHYLTAIGVAIGLAHVFALLDDIWVLLGFGLVAAVALVWRLLVIDRGLTAHPFRVTRVGVRAADLIEASLAPDAGALPVAPGQFVLASFGDGPAYRGCGEFHPFTVSGIGHDGTLSVSVKALGPCSSRIQSLEPGVLVRLQGPFGNFLASERDAPQLWIAGGIGITPFIAAARAGELRRPTTLIYLYRETRDAAFLDELTTLAQTDSKFDFIAQANGQGLPDAAALLARVSGLDQREVQICGPAGMVDAFTSRLRQLGLPDRSIHFERFDFR